MTDRSEENGATVVDFAAFKRKVSDLEAPGLLPPSPYRPVDGPTHSAIIRAYRLLHVAGSLDDNHVLHIVERDNRVGRHHVWQTRPQTNNPNLFFAIDPSIDDLEMLYGDLAEYDSDKEKVFGKQIERFYKTTLVARSILKSLFPGQRYKSDVPLPRLGDTEFHFEDRNSISENSQNWTDVTRWRIASGVGLAAVASGNPGLKSTLSEHLISVGEDRLLYMQALQDTEQRFGLIVPPDDSRSEQFLMGVCNPLNTILINQLIKPKTT